MNDSSYCKTFAFAVASDKASEWVALAKKWGVPVPVNGFGYADYTALKVELARFALLMDNHRAQGVLWILRALSG